MNKGLRIALNVLIFVIVAGFVWYMVSSLGKENFSSDRVTISGQDDFISPYKKINTIQTESDIIDFELSNDKIYVAVHRSIVIYDLNGTRLNLIPVGEEIRDLAVDDSQIYLLYPTKIETYTLEGEKTGGWEACSDHSDYCAFVLASGCVFVTDAENKNICKYTKEGNFVTFINSPDGFIIPSYAFDIININDTIYCINSGRHKIESYSTDGTFITSFGKAGSEAGAFAGCCNPVYLSATAWGDIITSEKGTPRICCYSRDGKFRTMLLDDKTLGGGTNAYKVKTQQEKIYTAGKNILSVFVFDPELATQSACAGCTTDCPLRKGIK